MFIVSLTIILLGVICIIFGFVIIKKKLVNAASRSAYVKLENVKAFTKLVGSATIGFGLAIFCMGVFFFMNAYLLGTILYIIILILSLVIYFKAQSKYN